jgi:hypothetical protein
MLKKKMKKRKDCKRRRNTKKDQGILKKIKECKRRRNIKEEEGIMKKERILQTKKECIRIKECCKEIRNNKEEE